ncbi:hypothetical protein [Flavobacterium sp.]|uniref:hypothetical protein n=1 Tax=Flavobacterium sp. TaxID=239 RepID=UPI0037519572
MNKENSQMPLEFQKINMQKIDINVKIEKEYFVVVELYKTNKVIPENFYKPISKILDFDYK